MKIKNLLVVMAAIVIVTSLGTTISSADQPRMQAAKANLENAQNSLRKATADKGGHRQLAMDLVARAITAVNNGIEYDRTHYTPGRRRHDSDFDADSFLATATPVDQPNMVNARAHLQTALGNLNAASVDKGGYREQALGYVRQAISEVNAGIEYDRTH